MGNFPPLAEGRSFLLALIDGWHAGVPEEDVVDGQEESEAAEAAQVDDDHEVSGKSFGARGLGEDNLLQLRRFRDI